MRQLVLCLFLCGVCSAGTIVNDSFTGDDAGFTSTWRWIFDASTGIPAPQTSAGVGLWSLGLTGLANGDLLVNYTHGSFHSGEAAESHSFTIAGVFPMNGGPVATSFPHPGVGHADVFATSWESGTALTVTSITITGSHIPEPGTFSLLLLGAALAGAFSLRRR